MTSPTVRSDPHIDVVGCAAIREEMGDRLRIALTSASDGLPQHLRMLVEQLAWTDGDQPDFAPGSKPQ